MIIKNLKRNQTFFIKFRKGHPFFTATFTKSEDDLGVATPDLVVKGEGQELYVEGEGFMGQYKPLSRASLEEKLEKE